VNQKTLRGKLSSTASIAVLCTALLWPPASLAQERSKAAEVAPQTAPASLGNTLARTATQNIAAGAIGMTVFSIGTGSLLSGAVLSTGYLAIGLTIYPINEFFWDYFDPNTNLRVNNANFDTAASFWRTTGKYLTFKTGTTISKVVMLYAYTGSVYSTATMSVVTAAALPFVFYANNMAWDWYDWYSTPATPAR
jgi:hypothetical protein